MAYADSQIIFDKTASFLRAKLNPFDRIIRIDPVKDKKLQFAGVDKILVTQNGKILKVEEKVRKKDWGDILVELIADHRYASYDPINDKFDYSELRGIGWGMKDYSTDLLLYYFEETDSGHLLSWKKFQAVFKAMLNEWYVYAMKNQYGFSLKIAKNKNYNTVNIAIPKDVLLNAYQGVGGKII